MDSSHTARLISKSKLLSRIGVFLAVGGKLILDLASHQIAHESVSSIASDLDALIVRRCEQAIHDCQSEVVIRERMGDRLVPPLREIRFPAMLDYVILRDEDTLVLICAHAGI
jgi:hypothetical protein